MNIDGNLLLLGVGAGLVTGLSGWWKNASADGKIERVELAMLLPTLGCGVLSGLAAHLPIPDSWKAIVIGLGPVALVNFFKGIVRHKAGIPGLFKAAVGDLKNPEAKPA